MEAKDVMSRRVISVRAEEPVSAAARLMKQTNVGALPVCDSGGRLRGLVTDRDIVTRCVALGSDPEDTPVSEIMTRGIVSAQEETPVEECAGNMARLQVRRLPVTENGRVVGMLTLADLLRQERCAGEFAQAMTAVTANVSPRRA